MKYLFVILLLALIHSPIHAQKQTISVSGQVRCGTELVIGSLVTMLQPADSSIVAYAVTDKQGSLYTPCGHLTGRGSSQGDRLQYQAEDSTYQSSFANI